MNARLITALITTLAIPVAANAIEPVWADRMPTLQAVAPTAAATYNDSFAAIGGHFRKAIKVGADTYFALGSQDIFVAVKDPAGIDLWSKHFGDAGINCDDPFCPSGLVEDMAFDREGNLYLVGAFSGNYDFGGGKLLSAPTNQWVAFIAKLTPTGKHIWSKAYPGGDFLGIEIDSENNVIVAGRYFAPYPADFTLGCVPFQHSGNGDIFVGKLLGGGGACVWANRAGGLFQDYAAALALDSNDNAIIGGRFSSSAIQFAPNAPIHYAQNGKLESYIAKFDNDGGYILSRTFGATEIRDLATDDKRNIFVTGSFSGTTTDFGGGPLVNSTPGTTDVFVASLDENSGHIWSRAFGNYGVDLGRSIEVVDDRVFVTGECNGTLVPTLVNCNATFNAPDIFVLELNGSGKPVSGEHYGDLLYQGVEAMALGKGSLFITGSYRGEVKFGQAGTFSGTDEGYVVRFDF